MADQNSGSSSLLRQNASIAGGSDTGGANGGGYTDVAWSLQFFEIISAPSTWSGTGIGASVSMTGVGTVWSGSFTFDWRPSGLQSITIASGTTRVHHNADGTPPTGFGVTGSINSTGTSGGGGPTSVTQGVSLPTRRVVPGTPSSVAAVRNSDTQATVSWAQTSASNGQPTSNTIRRKINDGAYADALTISPATSTDLACAANQKLVYGVKATNAAGDSGWSTDSTPIYTTPGAPTGVTATKVGSDIVIAFGSTVAFAEHEHVIEHGVDVAGTVTWDGSPLAVKASGTLTHTHAAPNPAQRHVYRVSARNLDVAALSSATVQSNVVQLLTAPAKPTVATPPAFADKAATFRFAWVHNSIDSSTQTKRQVRYSLDGGATWTTGSKTTSTAEFLDYAANTWTANQAVTFQVRTKGAYDSGSDGDASYSPWSDSVTVTFKTKPVVTIPSPANASTQTQAALTVVLGFTQAEAATFVSALIGLYQGATLLEEKASTTLAGTAFDTRLADGTSYSIKATVTDSNGLTSAPVTSTFSVDYTEPVAATVVISYLEDSGIAQLQLTIPAAGGGLVDATTVSIDRVINGQTEAVHSLYPTAPSLTLLDITPTIHGTNLYRITTRSADGATTVVEATLTTTENEWAYLSKDSTIVRFQLAPGEQAAPSVDSALLKASGRRRPIGLYATTGNLTVSGTGALAEGYGSTPEEIEDLLLLPGKACYRSPSGRRVFGELKGSISRADAELGELSFSITETD